MATKNVAVKGSLPVLVNLQGIKPLLMSAMPPEEVERIFIRKVREVKDPTASLEELASKGLYTNGKTDDEGNPLPCIPMECVFASIRDAGSMMKIPGQGNKKFSTGKSTVLPAYVSFLACEMTGPRTWVPDVRRGTLKDGTPCPIVRPKFDKWGFEMLMEVEQDEIDPTAIKYLIQKAGKAMGLMGFRPSCKGTFGMYRPTSWTVLSADESDALLTEHLDGNNMHEALQVLRGDDFKPTPFRLGA